MTTKKYKAVNEFINDVFNEGRDDFAIVAKYLDAKEIIKDILQNNNITPAYIQFESCDFNGYEDEFVIEIYENELYCEKLKRESGYLRLFNEATFLVGEVSNDFIKTIDDTQNLYIIKIDDGEELKDKSCVAISDDNGNVIGFTKTWSTEGDNYTSNYTLSFYSDDSEEIERAMKVLFGDD